jgi:hypothetical protein
VDESRISFEWSPTLNSVSVFHLLRRASS